MGHDGEAGHRARARLLGQELVAPELIDLEVVAAWRRLVRRGLLPSEQARNAVVELAKLPLRRDPHRPLLMRCWELRENVTAYDAAYVTLAEALDVPLLTTDARLSRASGPRCAFEVLE